MLIYHFPLSNKEESNSYLVACPETLQALLIDAGDTTDAVFRTVEQNELIPVGVFLTHHHYDHVNGVGGYLRQWECPIFAAHPLSGANAQPGVNIQIVKEGDVLSIGLLEARVFKTSGHTPDSLSLLVNGSAIFTGDALFAGSIGGTSDAAQKSELIGHIRRVVLSLPDEVEIFPGHGPATTVGLEKKFNPFLTLGA